MPAVRPGSVTAPDSYAHQITIAIIPNSRSGGAKSAINEPSQSAQHYRSLHHYLLEECIHQPAILLERNPVAHPTLPENVSLRNNKVPEFLR